MSSTTAGSGSRRAIRGALAAGLLTAAALGMGAAPASAAPATPAGEWWFGGTFNYAAAVAASQGANTRIAVMGPPVDTALAPLSGSLMPALSYPNHVTNIDTNKNTATCYSTQSAVLIAGHVQAGRGADAGYSGVAPQAKIVPMAVQTLNGELVSDPGFLAQAITAAVSLHVNVIDVDMPAPDNPALTQAVHQALSAGIVVVAPTGDEWETHRLASSPGDIPGVLAVTAVSATNTVPWMAGSADAPTLAAPGAPVLTGNAGGNFKPHDGTSCAAALAAGTVALVQSAHPKWTADQVVGALTTTASGHGKTTPDLGYGMISPAAAIALKTPPAGTTPLGTPSAAPSVSAAAPTTATSAAASSSSSSSSTMTIVYVAAGAVVLLLLIVGIILRLRRRGSLLPKKRYVVPEPAPYLGIGPQEYAQQEYAQQQYPYEQQAGYEQQNQAWAPQTMPQTAQPIEQPGTDQPAPPAYSADYEEQVAQGYSPPPAEWMAGYDSGEYPAQQTTGEPGPSQGHNQGHNQDEA